MVSSDPQCHGGRAGGAGDGNDIDSSPPAQKASISPCQPAYQGRHPSRLTTAVLYQRQHGPPVAAPYGLGRHFHFPRASFHQQPPQEQQVPSNQPFHLQHRDSERQFSDFHHSQAARQHLPLPFLNNHHSQQSPHAYNPLPFDHISVAQPRSLDGLGSFNEPRASGQHRAFEQPRSIDQYRDFDEIRAFDRVPLAQPRDPYQHSHLVPIHPAWQQQQRSHQLPPVTYLTGPELLNQFSPRRHRFGDPIFDQNTPQFRLPNMPMEAAQAIDSDRQDGTDNNHHNRVLQQPGHGLPPQAQSQIQQGYRQGLHHQNFQPQEKIQPHAMRHNINPAPHGGNATDIEVIEVSDSDDSEIITLDRKKSMSSADRALTNNARNVLPPAMINTTSHKKSHLNPEAHPFTFSPPPRNNRPVLGENRAMLNVNRKRNTAGSFKSPRLSERDQTKSNPFSFDLASTTNTRETTQQSYGQGVRKHPTAPVPVNQSTKFTSGLEIKGNEHRSQMKSNAMKFFVNYRAIFEPLLPVKNCITDQAAKGYSHSPVSFVEVGQPDGIVAVLKPYQLHGLSFLAWLYCNGMSGILGDEMGLGKTVQSLALLQYLKERGINVVGLTHLIVCPLSVLNSWMGEAARFAPHLKVVRFHGPKEEREKVKDLLRASNKSDGRNGTIDVVITTYEAFASEDKFLAHSMNWHVAIFDEGHRLKNSKTALATKFQAVKTVCTYLLTGTPLQNDLKELWSLLHLLYPEIFTENSRTKFKEAFDVGKGQVDTKMIQSAKEMLEVIMLRRMKDAPGVNLGLPPKEDILLFAPLTPVQRKWYLQLLTRIDEATRREVMTFGDKGNPQLLGDGASSGAEPQSKGQWQKLLNLLMQLRKVCTSPYLLKGALPEGVEFDVDEHVLTSSKFIMLDKIINQVVIQENKKLLIFSEFHRVLDFVEELLYKRSRNFKDFQHLRLDGSTPRARRNLSMRLFQDDSSPYKVFLLTTRAGGLGINLTKASSIVMLDHDWNPQVTLQAEARAHRIGQTNKVTIYKLCTSGTVEEQMLSRIQKKLYLSAKVTQSMKDIHKPDALTPTEAPMAGEYGTTDETDDVTRLGTTALKTLIRLGSKTLSQSTVNVDDLTSWDFNTFVDKCKFKPGDPADGARLPDLAEPTAEEEEKWLKEIEKVECAMWEGKKVVRAKDKNGPEIPLELNRADRRKGKETTVMQDGWTISKDSAGCADWEAVPTMAGKDPRLAEPTRAPKAVFKQQDRCQQCFKGGNDDTGGELIPCAACPRAFHPFCHAQIQNLCGKTGFGTQLRCPGHRCCGCASTASNAGGMLYRCRSCPKAWCEDCFDFETFRAVGDVLPELEKLGYGMDAGCFWVLCKDCYHSEELRVPVTDDSGRHMAHAARSTDPSRPMQEASRSTIGMKRKEASGPRHGGSSKKARAGRENE